jgi:hypothetical protein
MDEIRRADSFIDALAGGRAVAPLDAADAELATLLGTWRDETRWPPATGLIGEADAIAALNAGRAERRFGAGRDRFAADAETTSRKQRRGLSMVGVAAAAVLCIGGFGAVLAGAGPGDSLYGLRTMLFGGSKQTRDDQVGLAAKTTLNQVQDLIQQGNWDQAQNKLVEVSTQVASIGDEQQKQDLLDQFNNLSAKVVGRDPAATAPPGIVYTVAPSAPELVPALAPATSSSSASESTSPATTSTTSATTSTTSDSSTTSATAGTTTATSSDTASTSASVPATTSPASTSAATPGSTSANPSATTSAPDESGQPTTPTSAAPPATSAAPASAATTTAAAPVTSVPASPSAPASAAGTAAATAAATAPSSVPASPETPIETAQSPKAAVTTTVMIPVPVG